MSPRPRIVLYSPQQVSDDSPVPYTKHILPLSLLTIAGGARVDGFEVVVVDGGLYDQATAHGRLLELCEGALFYGTTGILGYQVADAFAATRAVKQRFPDLPAVIGGWFASTAPELQLETGLYDAVALGQGELTFRELAAAIAAGEALDGVAGLALWRDGALVRTVARGAVGWDKIEPTAWDLVDFEDYRLGQLRQRGRRAWESVSPPPGSDDYVAFSYFSSYGCPLACTFCCSPEVSNLRWKAMPAERMLDEILGLRERFGFDTLHYLDANYGVQERRVRAVAEGLVEAGVKLWQQGYMQSPSVCNYEQRTVDAMAESGFYDVLLGGETGTEETMKLLRKSTKPGENLRAARRLTGAGITPQVTYIIGLPGEESDSMLATLEEARRLQLACPEAAPQVWPYRPIPGTPTYRQALELGYRPPRSLAEWGETGDYRLHESWPGAIPARVSTRRRLFHHYASLSKGVASGGRTGFWERRAQRRLQRGDWRFARLEAKAFDLWWKVARGLG
jgi:radical SAM superfamily enzyme YgiQ (UPF0313 family)